MNLACVTMVYNEPDMLPLWLRHYTPVGDCFVIDHGSDDGSTNNLLGVERVRLPRTAHDNRRRADFVEDFSRALLRYYDAIVFTDVDELVVPDPNLHINLAAYAEATALPVVTALGLNVIHKLHEEVRLDPTRPIIGQRSYLFPTASMCKPVLIREPVRWSPGFHTYNGPVVFGGLFLFHLAYSDLTIACRRQAKRRSVEGASEHHRVSDDTVAEWLEGWSRMPIVVPTLESDCPVAQDIIDDVLESQIGREGQVYTIDVNLQFRRLLRIPPRFHGVL